VRQPRRWARVSDAAQMQDRRSRWARVSDPAQMRDRRSPSFGASSARENTFPAKVDDKHGKPPVGHSVGIKRPAPSADAVHYVSGFDISREREPASQ
jgi:hypothetical protein